MGAFFFGFGIMCGVLELLVEIEAWDLRDWEFLEGKLFCRGRYPKKRRDPLRLRFTIFTVHAQNQRSVTKCFLFILFMHLSLRICAFTSRASVSCISPSIIPHLSIHHPASLHPSSRISPSVHQHLIHDAQTYEYLGASFSSSMTSMISSIISTRPRCLCL